MGNYKQTIIVLSLIVLCVSCNNKTQNDLGKSSIYSKLEKVIISDSMDFPSIHFIISFKNKSDKNIILFTNSFYKKESYENAGLILSIDNITTPIGAMLKYDYISVDASSEMKIIFSYSPQYPNKWVKIDPKKNTRQELLQIVKKIHLKYHYDKELNDKALLESKNKRFTINEDFIINQKEYEIMYKNDIPMEEVIELLK
ncbi:hypothetical protein [Flavobacterium sp. '19STA2R22 D10 B1']|uniref:hypothetical protein n=1 Tax=Flavobacterium aerium TaxID=3037261 RepID=UPI00278C13E9|nr:hypothetical protein [Flavobacterium sp. '19STA2R22 D10 B1']